MRCFRHVARPREMAARCSPTSQASSPGRCCWPLSLMRCGGPSAVRTRTAAKRALGLPFVRVRQVMFRHLAPASMSSAGTDRTSGIRAPTRTAAPGGWGDELHTDRVGFEVPGDADSPGEFATRQFLAERGALPIAGIGQHTAEADTARNQTIDLGKRDLRLGSCRAMWDRNACLLQTGRIIGPVLRQKQTQGDRHWHFAASERQ